MNSSVKTTELIYLNEASKALKQKDFQIFCNVLIGIDSPMYCSFVEIDPNLFGNLALNSAKVNSRSLSAFIKTIVLESEFELTPIDNGYVICTQTDELKFTYDNNMSAINMYKRIATDIIYRKPLVMESMVNEALAEVFKLRKDDGCVYYIHANKYYLTLFSGVLPLTSTDKIYLTIFPNSITSFIAAFRIEKKKFKVCIFVNYLYV